jgi:LysM repeat protein
MLRRLMIVFLLLLTAASHAFSQKAEDVQRYIATYRELAISEMKRTGVPAAIKLAQGIHETEAGNSMLVRKSNNHFGIKCKTTWRGDKVFHDDDAAGECFRSYQRPEQSYMDHSDFLKNSERYAFLFELDPTDYEGWAYGLKKAGYATNIRYSKILISIINQYHLQDYTLIALGRMKQSDQMLVSNVPNVRATPVQELKPAVYPSGQFTINRTKVIFAPENTAWLAIAEEHHISLSRLWDFNDLENDDDILLKGQLVFLQRKRKVGSNEFHIVQKGESLYDICQSEGIRLESLLELNHLNGERQPAVGEKLYLQQTAAERPSLSGAPLKEKEMVKHAAYVNFPQDN